MSDVPDQSSQTGNSVIFQEPPLERIRDYSHLIRGVGRASEGLQRLFA